MVTDEAFRRCASHLRRLVEGRKGRYRFHCPTCISYRRIHSRPECLTAGVKTVKPSWASTCSAGTFSRNWEWHVRAQSVSMQLGCQLGQVQASSPTSTCQIMKRCVTMRRMTRPPRSGRCGLGTSCSTAAVPEPGSQGPVHVVPGTRILRASRIMNSHRELSVTAAQFAN